MLFVGNNALILLMYVNVLYIFCTILSCDVLISIGSTYWPTVFWLPRRRHKFVSTRYCQCQSQTHPSRNPRPPTALQKRKSNSQKISILPIIRISESKTYENNIFQQIFPTSSHFIAGWRVPRWSTPAPCGSTCRRAARWRACAACPRRTRRRRRRRRPPRRSSGSARWGWTSETCWMPLEKGKDGWFSCLCICFLCNHIHIYICTRLVQVCLWSRWRSFANYPSVLSCRNVNNKRRSYMEEK